jgi:hypothetical protein
MKQIKTAMYAQILYMLGMGAGLVFIPKLILPIFGFDAPQEIWVRVLGALALLLAYYYAVCVRAEFLPFIRATIVGRYAFCAVLAVFGILKMAPAGIFIFAAAETALAVWAHVALNKLKN